MRIVENSPDRVVLQDRTLRMSFFLFLAAGLPVLNYAHQPHKLLALLPVAFCGGFGLFFLRSSDVIFDKASRTCTIRRLDVWKLTRRSLAFDDIKDIRVDVSFGGGSGAISCRLTLVTTSGEEPLSWAYQPGQTRYDVMREAVADAVFDRTPRPPPPDPLDGLMRAGRFVDAIAYLRKSEGLGLAEAKSRVDALRAVHGA